MMATSLVMVCLKKANHNLIGGSDTEDVIILCLSQNPNDDIPRFPKSTYRDKKKLVESIFLWITWQIKLNSVHLATTPTVSMLTKYDADETVATSVEMTKSLSKKQKTE